MPYRHLCSIRHSRGVALCQPNRRVMHQVLPSGMITQSKI